jgi:hypothetical protein
MPIFSFFAVSSPSMTAATDKFITSIDTMTVKMIKNGIESIVPQPKYPFSY